MFLFHFFSRISWLRKYHRKEQRELQQAKAKAAEAAAAREAGFELADLDTFWKALGTEKHM